VKKKVAIGMFLMTAWAARAVLVDDFDAYWPGDVDMVTGGVWVESPARSSTGMTIVQESLGNRALSVMNCNDGQTGVYGILTGDEIIPDGQTKTLFVRFFITSVSGTYDVSFGLTGIDVPTSWTDLASYFTIVNGAFNVRQGTVNTTVANVKDGQWYYVWLVVNNNAKTHTCYLKTVAQDATISDRVAENWGMRVTTSGNLDRLFAMTNFIGSFRPVYFDTIFITDGVSLALPGGAPPVIVSNPADAIANPGAELGFETVFTSQSEPTVRWFKAAPSGDQEMDPDAVDTSMEISYNPFSRQYTASLRIRQITMEDAGQYYCHVNNDSRMPAVSSVAVLTVRGLVARWTFDKEDYTGGLLQDVVGGHNALPAGMPVFVNGADGTEDGALQIKDGSGWAEVEEFDLAFGSGALTLSVWANWQDTAAASGTLQMDDYPDDSILSVENGLSTDDQWQHFCIVYTGTEARLYIDGLLAVQGPWILPSDTTAILNIGSSSGGRESFNGYLDDLRIYNYAMSDTDVADLYYQVSGQGVCLPAYTSVYDLTGPQGKPDCFVDLYDLVFFVGRWLVLYDFEEFAGLAADWQVSSMYPN
jgi:hypothetical protein